MLLKCNSFNCYSASAVLVALPALSARYALNRSSLLSVTLRSLTLSIGKISLSLN
jgi:hypothetical protein